MHIHDIHDLIHLQAIIITNFSIKKSQSLLLTVTLVDTHQT